MATLHYCYDSKDDLLADVYGFVTRRYQDAIMASDPHAGLPATARQLLRGVMELYVESIEFTATALELSRWATRQHSDRGVGVYDQAMEALRSVLAEAAAGLDVGSGTIDRTAYVIAILSDGFTLNWLTYGDRSAATEHMATTMSVLDGWLETQLGSADNS